MLSNGPGCSRELWCRKMHYVASKLVFLKLYFMHISKDILLLRAQNGIKNVNDTFPYSRNVKNYENVKLVIMHGCTAAPYIMHEI